MLKTIIELPDGTILSSGTVGENAIRSLTLTQCVNDSQELSLGSVCANMAELAVITPKGDFSIQEGDEFTLYRQDEAGICHKVGIFISEKPVRTGAHSLKITAYDRISRLDQELSQWLEGLTGWPYSLLEFAKMTCRQCGLELTNEQIPNGHYLVQKFSAQSITGRTIIKWAGQIAGRFCRADPNGRLEFAWYKTVDLAVGDSQLSLTWDEAGNVTLRHPGITAGWEDGAVKLYGGITVSDDGQGNVALKLQSGSGISCYQDGLKYADYQVRPVEKVQLKCAGSDVGTVYPEGLTGAANTYVIEGNFLLTATAAHTLSPIAQTLYEQLKTVTYTPCTIKLPAGFSVSAGDIVTVTDSNGVTVTAYVMTKRQANQADTLECTGSPSRGSTSAVNHVTVKALTGKVLDLTATVDGIRAENRDAAGKVAALSLDVEGITSEVSRQQADMTGVFQQLTQLHQTEEAMQLRIQNVEQQGVGRITTETGFTFDEKGLTISKSGTQMENLLDETGMFVKRSGTVILQADQSGVEAADVSVRNYLVIGDHARLEDYGGSRTACFWI